MNLQLPPQIHVKEVLEFGCFSRGCSHWTPSLVMLGKGSKMAP